MVKLNKIYTRTGDDGTTGLVRGPRRFKYDLRVACYGTIDEANSVIGVCRLLTTSMPKIDSMLARIQNDLFDLGADLSAPEDGRKAEGRLRVSGAQVERLEREIDAMNEKLAPLTSFILPGGTALAAHLHLARAIARRAEAAIVGLAAQEKINDAAIRYANRLSDHGRCSQARNGLEQRPWLDSPDGQHARHRNERGRRAALNKATGRQK